MVTIDSLLEVTSALSACRPIYPYDLPFSHNTALLAYHGALWFFKVIQDYRFSCHLKANMRLPLSKYSNISRPRPIAPLADHGLHGWVRLCGTPDSLLPTHGPLPTTCQRGGRCDSQPVTRSSEWVSKYTCYYYVHVDGLTDRWIGLRERPSRLCRVPLQQKDWETLPYIGIHFGDFWRVKQDHATTILGLVYNS